jgi:hypothetical protein
MADLFVFGNNVPDSPLNGQCWIQAETGQVWTFLNNEWRTLTGGEKFIFEPPFTVFIAATNRNENIGGKSLKIKNILTHRIDICSFLLYDNGDSNIRPVVGEQIDIFEYGTNEKVFGGEIANFTQKQISPGIYQFVYTVSCTDFTKRLHRKLATKDYTNQKAGDIIKDLIDTYIPEFSYANVADGPTIDFLSFNYKPIDECIKKIAKITNYEWYVDYTKDINFFLPSTEYAPYTITENPETSGHHNELIISQNKTQYRNKVYLLGALELSSFDDIQVADGSRVSFNLSYEPYNTVSAFVDTGGGFVAKTVGIDGVDTSGYDFVVNRSDKVLRNLDLATLNNGDILKVTYNRKTKLIVNDSDAASISQIQSIEGGDGIYEFKLEDDTIETLDAGRERVDAELRDHANPIINGRFLTDQRGYKAGQILQINLPSWGYSNKEYNIFSVTTSVKSGVDKNKRAYIEYAIEFSTFFRGFYEFIQSIYNKSIGKEIVIKGDEKLTS